jgi:hypothetical protein
MTKGRASKKRLVSFVMRAMKIFYPQWVGLVVVFSLVAFAGEPGTIGTAEIKVDGTIAPRPDPTLH